MKLPRSLVVELRTALTAMARVPSPDPLVDATATHIGSALGYGATMRALSRAWSASLTASGAPSGGEFTVGPTRAHVKTLLDAVNAALAADK